MTPSQKAKSLGFKSLAELSRLSGESEQTLINWFKNYPKRFEFIAIGVFSATVLRDNNQAIEYGIREALK
jgi:hypothetical protein